MSGLDLHPEDLLDREARGALTDAERAHLAAHLAQCAACRFERTLRADFERELGSAHERARVRSLVSGALFAVTEQRAQGFRDEVQSAQVVSPSRRPRKRAWLLAAMLLFVSGLAFAQTEAVRRVLRYAQRTLDLAPGADARSAEARHAQTASPRLAPPEQPAPPPVPADGVGVGREPSRPRGTSSLARGASPGDRASASIREETTEPGAVRARRGARPSRRRRTHLRTSRRQAMSVPAPAASAEEGPAEAFERALAARRDGRVEEAIVRFERLADAHPALEEGRTARVLAARLHLDRGEAQAALVGYQRYLDAGVPTLREQALVGVAESLRVLGAQEGLRRAIARLRAEYPDSPRLPVFEGALAP